MIKKFTPIFEEKKYRANREVKRELERIEEERQKVERRLDEWLRNYFQNQWDGIVIAVLRGKQTNKWAIGYLEKMIERNQLTLEEALRIMDEIEKRISKMEKSGLWQIPWRERLENLREKIKEKFQ